METLRFTLSEMLSLFGVMQCLYILVYVSFRAGNLFRVALPLLYFSVLGLAFLIDFSRGYIYELIPYFDVISWGMWTLGTPLSVLLILHMSQITKLPALINWSILLIVPVALTFSIFAGAYSNMHCYDEGQVCTQFFEWLNISGLIAGAVSLLVIWFRKNLFEDLLKQKAGKERYWLILSLIMVNISFLFLIVFSTTGYQVDTNLAVIRTILGLGFVYIVSTSLFRIYPSALNVPYQKKNEGQLSLEEMGLAAKIESLLKLEKIYHENTYSRSDLAQELGVAESTISRVINLYFKKSFPQLLNEYRVEDSKQLLLDTDASIRVVASEVGFNSLPSFNRVFKEITGQSPSSYRKNTIK
ncbi:MAG: helix-turn-helix domain-containing protein [Alphaproteobacteria bacterium]